MLYAGGMVVLWAFNLVNGTGLGETYHTTEYAQVLSVLLSAFMLWRKIRKEGICAVEKRYFYVILLLLGTFVAVSFLNGYKFMSLDYLWAFLIVFILANTRPSQKTLKLVGLCYAALGLAILFIFNYMDALDKWNPNSIAMIGLFSYLVFVIPYFGIRDLQSVLMLTLVGGAYVFLLWPTESRSCIITLVIALVLTFRVISIEKLITSRTKILFAMLVPLLVALTICVLSLLGNVAGWDEWSMEKFGKPIFNGRDLTWLEGLSQMRQALWFGNGQIISGYWHNSAIACLTAYGAVGFSLWIAMFCLMINDTRPYQKDICVQGALTAFLVIYWQQSVELGFFSNIPNLIPYAILGIMLGRCHYLREKTW